MGFSNSFSISHPSCKDPGVERPEIELSLQGRAEVWVKSTQLFESIKFKIRVGTHLSFNFLKNLLYLHLPAY